jgi:rRNA maturation endonuclease Nob1
MTNERQRKIKRTCPICDAELGEEEDICPNCGACLEEPCYDTESDMDEG